MDKEDLKWKEMIQQMERASRAFATAGRTMDGRIQIEPPAFSFDTPSIPWIPSKAESKKDDDELKYINIFNDINEVIDYIGKAKINHKIFNPNKLASEEIANPWDLSDFHDFENFKYAVDSLKFGTDKYFNSFNHKLKKVNDYIKRYAVLNKISYKNDVVGFTPIVPNTIIGNPINMINQKKKERIIPTATIVFEKAVTCRNRSEDMVSFASIIFSLIQVLEQKGIRCQIYVSSLFRYDEEIFGYKIKIKNYMQPLNLYKMQFPVISSDMFRRIGFRLLETCNDLKHGGWEDSYGKTLIGNNGYDLKPSGEPTEKLQELLNIKNTDIFIPSHSFFGFHSNDDISSTIRGIIDRTNFSKYIKLDEEE